MPSETTAQTRGMLPGMGSHHRAFEGESEEWWTPPHVFEALGIEFDLDVAGPLGGVPWIPVARTLTREDDGLQSEWAGRVWLNPPYGPETVKWLRRMIVHGNGIALVFARTDTAWFHEIAPTADAICLLEGRLTFYRSNGRPAAHNSGAPSMLLGWGEESATAVEGCGLGLGIHVR